MGAAEASLEQAAVDEPDDELIGEADVILSQPPKNSDLYLLQYPLRTQDVPIGTERSVEGVSIRPRHGRVEMRLSVVPTIQQDGVRENCAKSFDKFQDHADEKAIGDVQLLRSQPSVAKPHANYAAARYAKDTSSFVIVPLRTVTQLRPAFDYLDAREAAIAKQRAEDKAARAAARGLQTEGPEENEIAPLQVSFRRRETEKAAERRRNSHASITKREMEEPWLPLQYKSDTASVEETREALFSPARTGTQNPLKEEDAAFEPDTSYMDLFQAHTRSVKLGIVTKGSAQSEPLSMRALQRLPTNSAVAQVITHTRIMRFEDLLRVAPSTVPAEEVLNATRIVAVILRGCWVAKNSTLSSAAKVKRGSERYDAARVLVLNLFRLSKVVTCADAIDALGHPPALSQDRVESILSEVAHRETGVGWVFRLEDDLHFQEEYPDLVAAQEADWDRRVAMAKNLLTSKHKR